MRFTDLLRISSRQVLRQYRKNIGVAMAIVLGTAGLIVILTMGKSVEENIGNNLEIIGNATRIRIVFRHLPSTPDPVDTREFTQKTINALRSIPGVDHVSSIVAKNDYAKLTFQNNTSHFEILGVDDSFWRVHGSSAQHGVLFAASDIQQRRSVCVLGQRTALELFGQTDAAGQFVAVDSNLFQIVGVIDTISMPDKDRVVFLPITTALDRLEAISPVNKIYMRCHSWDDVKRVAAAVPGIIRSSQPGEEIEIFVPEEILTRVQNVAFGVKIFVHLALIATLLLGGIGIWNIMMMSVRSRTREIGLKKAIGAEDHDILFQFLSEALILSISATSIGILLGLAGVEITAAILKNTPATDLFWISTCLGFCYSFIIGIAAGLAPAINASKMEVVTALRYE